MKAWYKPSVQWLFAFVPVAVIVDRMEGLPAPVAFFCAGLSIIPVASLIIKATEEIAHRTGDTIGGLLNATFGNLPELIVSIVALKAGLVDMVRASLIGAVLVNLLFTLGLAFFLGGLRYHNQEYSPSGARIYSTMMMLAAFSLMLPSAFHRFLSSEAPLQQESQLDIGVAIILLAAYGLNLLFMLKTHPEVFKAASTAAHSGHEVAQWSALRAVGTLLAGSALAAWMSEILVGAAEGTGQALGMSEVFIGMVFLAVISGAAGTGSAVAMARKDKMDLSIGIALGSSVQVTLFSAPVLVFLSYIVAPKPLVLQFMRAEIALLFLAVMIATVVAGDGRSNWFKGVQLLTFYLIIAVSFYLIPT